MSARDFLNLLKERSLLDDAIIADLRRQLEESDKAVSAETIAKLLVENEHLTRFQATNLVGETTKDIEARRAKRADDKADQVSGIEATDDDLLAVKEPEPDSIGSYRWVTPHNIYLRDVRNECECERGNECENCLMWKIMENRS